MSAKVEITTEGVIVTRVFDAKIQRVFDAWTIPEQVQSWWGCAQTKSVESHIELEVGGEYRHIMDIEGAGKFDVIGTITELTPPTLLTYAVAAVEMEGMPPMPAQEVTIEFEEMGNQTQVRLTHKGIPNDLIKGYVSGGWQAALEKLSTQIES